MPAKQRFSMRRTRRNRGRRGERTANSESLSQMISCDTSGMVKEPLTSVPSLVFPVHDSETRVSKIVMSLNGSEDREAVKDN